MITENTLRVKIEATGDGQLKASLEGGAQSVGALDAALQAQASSAGAAATTNQAAATATQAVGESAAEAETRIKAMVQASLQRQQADMAAIAASTRSVDANKAVAVSVQDQITLHQKAMAAAEAYRAREAAAGKASADTSGIDAQRASLNKLVGQIDPTIAALDRLDRQQAKLAAFKKSGLLGAEDFNRFSAAIDTNREKINAAGEAVSHFSLNNSMARRELGYLLKDLAMGNYGRFQQSALTLANASGLMSLAFTGAGLAIGATAAVLAVFGLAAVKGMQESERLRMSVVATGGANGASAVSFDEMAASVGRATGKYGEARAAVELLAASGKVAGAGIGGLAQQAVDMSIVTGESIDKSVAKILELAQKPAEAIAALNEQYHFLTAAQYAEIAALEAEGNTRTAGRLANQLDAQAMADRARDVEDNAGIMQRAGHAVAVAWGTAWDAMKGIGRTQGLGDQVKAVQEQIDQLQGGRYLPNGNFQQGVGNDDPRVKILQSQLADLRRQQVEAAFAANATELDARGNQDAIAAQQRLSKYMSPKDTLDNELKKANSDRLAAMYGVVDPAQKARIQSQYDDQVKTAHNAYNAAVKKLAGPKGPKNPEVSAYGTFSNYVDGLDVKAITADDTAMTQYQQGIAKLADQMAAYMAKGGDATKAAALFNRGQQDLQKTLDNNHAKERVAQQQYAAALDKTNAALQLQVNNEIARIGMGDKEYQRTQQVAKAYQDEADALEKLALQRQAGINGESGGLSKSSYDADVTALRSATARKIQIMRDGYQQMDEAQADWAQGAQRAYQNFVEQAADVAGQTDRLFTNTFNGLGDAIANFVVNGKNDFSSLIDSMISDLIKMEARILESQALEAIVGMVAGSYGGAGTNTFSSIGTDTSGGSINYVSHVGGHAEGGRISGAGTGTSDSIIARLSNGENVMTAKATDYYGQRFMDDVNNMRLPRFAQGGAVGGSNNGGGSNYGQPAPQIIVNNNTDSSVKASSQQQPDGRWITQLIIDTVSGDLAGGGKSAKAMEGRYGLSRRGVPVGG